MNLDDIKKADDPKIRIQQRLQQLSIPSADVQIDDQYNIVIDTNVVLTLAKVMAIKQMGRSVQVLRAAHFNTGDFPVTEETLKLLPKHAQGGLRLPRAISLHNIHKYVKYIDGEISLSCFTNGIRHAIPTHMLGLGLIDGAYAVSTRDHALNKIFDEHVYNTYEGDEHVYTGDEALPLSERDNILVLQDKLIDAGYIEQAKL